LPSFDTHAPLLSLPGLLGTSEKSIPASVPYFTADPARIAHWQRELAGVDEVRVGIVWQGSHHIEATVSARFGSLCSNDSQKCRVWRCSACKRMQDVSN